MSQKIDIDIRLEQSYTVMVGNAIWDDFLEHCRACYSARQIFIVIDANVNRLHGKKIKAQCSRYFDDCTIIEIPAGEQSKSTGFWKQLVDKLLNSGVERSTPLLAVGGGVTGDLAGFVAASALRGIPLIHMPTSLLAMVDSSIGGKTGINHSAGKNLIGAFYQPEAVFVHLPFLQTLPEQEWVNGLSEMLKYAAIKKPTLFDALKQAIDKGFKPNEQWEMLIDQCAKIKKDFVQQDVHEAGKRVFLNFGHTFGHALEKVTGYGTVSHGEAVFAGMLAATHLSGRLRADVNKIRFAPFKTLYSIPLPDKNNIEALIEAMHADKKVVDGKIRLILLNEWGKPCIKNAEDDTMLHEAWEIAFDTINEK